MNDLDFWHSQRFAYNLLSYHRVPLFWKNTMFHPISIQKPKEPNLILKLAKWFQRRSHLKILIDSITVTFGQGHWMTLTFGIHRDAWSTFFHITEYHCFGKIHCFALSPFKSPRDQIWPWWKIGQGQPKVTIWTNLVVLSHLMLHIKFQGNQPSGSGEEDFIRFLPYMGIMAILAMRAGPSAKIFNLPLPGCCMWNLIEIGPVVSEKSFEKVDDADANDADGGSLSIL